MLIGREKVCLRQCPKVAVLTEGSRRFWQSVERHRTSDSESPTTVSGSVLRRCRGIYTPFASNLAARVRTWEIHRICGNTVHYKSGRSGIGLGQRNVLWTKRALCFYICVLSFFRVLSVSYFCLLLANNWINVFKSPRTEQYNKWANYGLNACKLQIVQRIGMTNFI